MGDVYNALDCFVLASPHEAFSLALAEAWYCGIPTVSTPVGAVPELEKLHEQLTVRVPVRPSGEQLADAVREAMSDANRPVIQRAQKAVAEHYTVEKMGARWSQYIVDLVQGNNHDE